MAKSRVGGTKGMLTGQVGKDIYQIRNNGDGTYTQIVYAKGERTETTFTPKVQAQRMVTGMVESLMKQLKPVIGMSFQAGRNVTTSCNSFSAANIRLVQRDCQDHWDAHNAFVYPVKYKGYPDFSELGGPYMISSGSLTQDLFDEVIFDDYAPAGWDNLPQGAEWLYGLRFDCRIGVDTLEQFRQAHRMTILDKVVFAGFRNWLEYEPDPEDPLLFAQHNYFIASFNRQVSSAAILTRQTLASLFKFKTNMEPTILFARDNSAFCIGYPLNNSENDERFYYWAGFSEAHRTGKKLISTSFYGNDVGDVPYLADRQPSMVFGSWMGEPQRKPYPSPW